MVVFNPNILTASIQAITSSLREDQKAEVLLFAARFLSLARSRHAIENAVESCLLIPDLDARTSAKLHMLRVKARNAAGINNGVVQDVRQALEYDPENVDAKAMSAYAFNSNFLTSHRAQSPGKHALTVEIWREVITYLPRMSLVPLFSVPHPMSRIASHRFFETISLDLTNDDTVADDVVNDGCYSRAADKIAFLIVDQQFASRVKRMRIQANPSNSGSILFQKGMLAKAIPNLTNLADLHISMKHRDAATLLHVVEKYRPNLQNLSLCCEEDGSGAPFPRFGHLTHLTHFTIGGSGTSVFQEIMKQTTGALRELRCSMNLLPLLNRNFLHSLTCLHVGGLMTEETVKAIDYLARHNRSLQELEIKCDRLMHPISHVFEANKTAFPLLKSFYFHVRGGQTADAVFPAIADFLRGKTGLLKLGLSMVDAPETRYDASIWGILPTLPNLRALYMTITPDASPALIAWLLPRKLRALTLHSSHPCDSLQSFLEQIRPGIPPQLRIIQIDHSFLMTQADANHGGTSTQEVLDAQARTVFDCAFPMVQVVAFTGAYYPIVTNADGTRALTIPGRRMVDIDTRLWLDTMDCSDLIPVYTSWLASQWE